MSRLENAIAAGAARALRRRALVRREKSQPVRNEMGSLVRSSEAALALKIADGLDAVADEIEREARRQTGMAGADAGVFAEIAAE